MLIIRQRDSVRRQKKKQGTLDGMIVTDRVNKQKLKALQQRKSQRPSTKTKIRMTAV